MTPKLAASDLAAKALADCSPTEAEARRIDSVAMTAKELVERQVSELSEVVSVEFGGSYAKGTWLRDHADIDIFVKMQTSVGAQDFERLGKSIGLDALRDYSPVLRYADHPYVEAEIRRTRINVVPCYDVKKGEWISAADRSPFHTQFVNEILDAEKKNHVRALKKFLKSAGIYGAEIAVAGFSGYVCEVLIAKFGSLLGVLESLSDLKRGQVIAMSSYDEDIVKTFQSAVIIIDPIDARRNLGTAVSNESVASFMLAARSFLEKPSPAYFGGTRIVKRARTVYNNVLVVEFSHKKRSPDIVWGQLKRSTVAVSKQLGLAGFSVIRSSCVTDENGTGVMSFLLESLELPQFMMRAGPEVFRRTDTSKFLQGASGAKLAWVDRDMRTSILVRRKATEARTFAKSLFHNENSGISADLVSGRLKIYTGGSRAHSGIVKQAVENVAGTEHLFFRN